MSDRTEMTGVHLRPLTKKSLQAEAIKRSEREGRSVSMSEIASEAVEALLKSQGHTLQETHA